MPITVNDVFRVDTPSATDDPREGDDRMREIKAAVMERMQNGGHYMEDETDDSPESTAGRLACGVQDTNLLRFYETDRTTVMAAFNDSTNALVLGTGRGGGANSWIIEAETGNFENVDIDGTLDVAGTTTLAGISLASQSVYGIRQTSGITSLVLTASYQAVSETVAFTTAAAGSDVEISWNGNFQWEPAASTDDVSVDIQIVRDTSTNILSILEAVRIDNMPVGQRVTIPISVRVLDTTAVANTAYTWGIRARATIAGTPTLVRIGPPDRLLFAVEHKFN